METLPSHSGLFKTVLIVVSNQWKYTSVCVGMLDQSDWLQAWDLGMSDFLICPPVSWGFLSIGAPPQSFLSEECHLYKYTETWSNTYRMLSIAHWKSVAQMRFWIVGSWIGITFCGYWQWPISLKPHLKAAAGKHGQGPALKSFDHLPGMQGCLQWKTVGMNLPWWPDLVVPA